MNKRPQRRNGLARSAAIHHHESRPELLPRNEYLAGENDSLRARVKGRLQLHTGEKSTVVEIASLLGSKALAESLLSLGSIPFCDGYASCWRMVHGGDRPSGDRGSPAIENFIVRAARENPAWGYDRIVGALTNLGHTVSDQTVGNIPNGHGIAPAPRRKQTTRGRDFIRARMDVLTGTHLFTVEVLTLKGLRTYYMLFLTHVETRRVCLAGIMLYPDQQWMEQKARNVNIKDGLSYRRYLLHDRDGKVCPGFLEVVKACQVRRLKLAACLPNPNAWPSVGCGQ